MNDEVGAEDGPPVGRYRRVAKSTHVNYLSADRRSNQPSDRERVRSASKVIEQAEHVAWVQEGEKVRLHLSPGGREEIVATFGVGAHGLRRLTIQRFYTDTGRPAQASLSFSPNEAKQVLKLFEVIAASDDYAGESTIVDDEVLEAIQLDPSNLERLFAATGKEQLEELIQSDINAQDVVAVASRRAALEELRKLLTDPTHFEKRAQLTSGPERAWQDFFEKNEWIFGLGLCHVFLKAWDPKRLEQVTTGQSVVGVGKRVDALLATTGFVSSLCFTEIKTHQVQLLQKDPNRPGVWAPSRPLVEAVAQIQRTVDEATFTVKKYLEGIDPDGNLTGQRAHLVAPRSFLVIGSLQEFTSGKAGQEHPDKIRSFELYRGSLSYPEIVTFDELLARAGFVASPETYRPQQSP